MGSSRRSIAGALAAMLLCLGCGGTDDGTGTTGAAGPTVTSDSSAATADSGSTDAIDVTEAPTTATTVVDSQTASTEDDDDADPESDDHRGPALASVDDFIASWAAVVTAAADAPDLMPTISSADVELDPTVGVDAFVEQASPSTVIGGIADPDTGIVTGLMGLSDSTGTHATIMIEILWTGAFGTDHGETLSEYFPAGDLEALEIGEQVTRVHRDKSIVLSHVDGANPDEGLYVFTIGNEELLTDDPSHDSITNVVLGLLVRTS